MVNANLKPVAPDRRARDLAKELTALEREPAGAERAERLAVLVRSAHTERQLNLAMHAAAQCLDDDPDAPALLIDAYAGDTDPEECLRTLSDLRDLARYVDRPDLVAFADRRMHEEALAWVRDGEEHDRRHRLRTVQNAAGRAVADAIRDELRSTP
ncbi:hypothetical protein [Egicoccus halophilus]|uniref:Uncharacterized protein n=1 Tax=Egicoccus halophilus TaxID=1670830 RepID=A0A8J3AA91_9ACTN|nr:hypothetical protein [Egicoccus halophilus]GGI02591.1 hypothetical protein GCM10011354_00880 [Egicoccus halophilus]